MKEADWDPPYNAAETFTVDWPLGEPVAAVTGNAAVDAKAGILTEAGVLRAGPSLETATVTPPAGAGLVRVRVQVLEAPAVRLVASHESVAGSTGLRFTVAAMVLVELFRPAVRVTL